MVDYIIGGVLIVIVVLIVRKLILDKKRGISCGSCPSTGGNHCDCEKKKIESILTQSFLFNGNGFREVPWFIHIQTS